MTDRGESASGPDAGKRGAHRAGDFASTTSFVFGRQVSFFDAVYGFAATLLISNVDAPPASAWRSLDALIASGAGTQLVGFILSFTVIVVLWRVNVRLTRRLRGLDGVTVVANLVAAASVVLIAFTTQGVSDPASADLPLPTALYAANIALAALCQSAFYQVGRARGLERRSTDARSNLWELVGAAVTPVVFLISIPVAFSVGTTAAKLTWASLLVLSPIAGTIALRAVERRAGGDPDADPDDDA
ncbi:TMEM175 family protein [Microbacterium ulmi]|uniref:DUF1211 domain-containing protein n=1 Tax=Microbacterium ulmi TaxID=179095 RepID=A0A7Y2M578_9MICO|nr:TMEM175 family protein [Microbacterium ulmi]NII70953.1 putative membrane protein [Microbacterium ulmi]NNH05313.1 DUF1211 domain-containing protein [Microbacterium ulmi]